jgi:hypothetical protein
MKKWREKGEWSLCARQWTQTFEVAPKSIKIDRSQCAPRLPEPSRLESLGALAASREVRPPRLAASLSRSENKNAAQKIKIRREIDLSKFLCHFFANVSWESWQESVFKTFPRIPRYLFGVIFPRKNTLTSKTEKRNKHPEPIHWINAYDSTVRTTNRTNCFLCILLNTITSELQIAVCT